MSDEPTVATPIHDARGCRILIRGGRADIQRPVCECGHPCASHDDGRKHCLAGNGGNGDACDCAKFAEPEPAIGELREYVEYLHRELSQVFTDLGQCTPLAFDEWRSFQQIGVKRGRDR